MKKFICLLLLSFAASHMFAQGNLQPIKIPLNKPDHVIIYTDAAFIDAEGYDGTDILVSPQRAEGNKLLKMRLLADNGNNGDSLVTYQSKLTNEANNYVVNTIKIATNCLSIKILIPNHLPLLSVEFNTTSSDGLLQVKNYKGPVQIAAYFSGLQIEGLTGPFNITDQYGKVSVKHIIWSDTTRWSFDKNKRPYSIWSHSSDINITVPQNLKAYFYITKNKGKVYSDQKLSSGLVMNGGGVGITIESTAGNIFLNHENNK